MNQKRSETPPVITDMWQSCCVTLVIAPQLCGRRNLSLSVNSSLGLVLYAKIPPSRPIYPPNTPSPCGVWRQLQWAPDVAWHPSSHCTGCGLKVVWKHHPPADPMKVPQTVVRGFCCMFVFVWTAGVLKCRSTHPGKKRVSVTEMFMCYLFSMFGISKYVREFFPSVSVDLEIATSFIHPLASILCSHCIYSLFKKVFCHVACLW